MKKTIFALAAGVITSFAAISNAPAQAIAGVKLNNENEKSIQALMHDPDMGLTAIDNKSLINAKALKDFAKSFKNVPDANWYLIEGGFAAKFTQDGIRNRVDYDKKGRWVASFRYYGEDNLPKDVRHLVKSTYYDFNITNVTEVSFEDKTAYLVRIEDKNSLKLIRVVEGEMDVMEDFVRK